ncbi:MAG TPA: hypothetical protein VM802_08555 [Chitinophaga sp.]|uniref:hypothetical protein n=1 Tax=Chitinophaga sp. TaxID=1869181 RepID=UPI002C9E43A1|nr:hypothetical protein [Chitinophaga sp.]HVI44907.1 hypothetical protein [Chitinophaga sp.]
MHDIEPYYNWRHLYTAEEDELSPFYGREYSEFEFSNTVYNYYVHPQWDDFGSRNLYLKILYADYQYSFVIIELLGEWNDAIDNDIMTLKREIIDLLISQGVYKYILIAENVMNFHSSDDCYYEEWWEDIKDEGGWIACLNMPPQTRQEFERAHLSNYVHLMDDNNWRTYQPLHLYNKIDNIMLKLLE